MGADSRPAISETLVKVRTTIETTESVEATLWIRQWKKDGSEVSDSFSIPTPFSMAFKTSIGRPAEAWASSDGWWSPTYLLAASEAQSKQEVHLYPTATLEGKLSIADGEELPEALSARFEQAAELKTEPAIPRSTVVCPVVEGSFSCELPASTLDLRLKAEGFVAHYRFGLRLGAGTSKDLGSLALQRGASVVGQVEDGRSGESLSGARVELVPERLGHAANRTARARQEQGVLSAVSGAKGFFQISGVPPGQYKASAKKETLGESQVRKLKIFEGKELTLTKPLRVYPPATLDVTLSSVTDPYGKPWRVAAQRLGERRARLLPLLRTETPPYRWRVSDLSQGEYGLTVQDDAGSSWAFLRIAVAGEDISKDVAVDFVAIEGTVLLDGAPLAATLWFGGRSGGRKLKLESDSEGKYAGLLPEAGRWPVDLEAADPPIRRRLRAVEIPDPENGITRFDFDLADLELQGQIVNEDGEGLPGFVLITREDERPTQISSDRDGKFELRGLEAGTLNLQAFVSGGASSSELETLELQEGKLQAPLELVIQDATVVEGQVVSEWGGVAGAQVLAHASRQDAAATLIMPQAQTDVNGTFRLRVPAGVGSLHLAIAAPGYGLTSRRLDPSTERMLSIRVYRPVGTLLLQFGLETTLQDFDRKYRLSHNGNPLSFALLYRWQQIYNDLPSESEDHLRIPMLEFGEFELCARGAEPPRCQRDVLPPFGEISFTAP